jgi:hypothetical protein
MSFACILFTSSCSRSVSKSNQHSAVEYLRKTNLDTSKNSYGSHIEVKQVLPAEPQDRIISNDIDDRDMISRSKYTRDEEIKILGEYLTFRGDTSVSNKRYKFKPAYYMTRPDIVGFTVQIEALYSFTRMLTQGLPPIKPMLIDRSTGEELNTNAKVVSEVYDIYVKWYKENLKTDFKNITLPLKGSPYCWLGEDKGMESFMRKSL